jgi:hypothetical protein
MSNITTITLTGADEQTPIEQLKELVESSSHVEIGFLLTASKNLGRRYPNYAYTKAAFQALSGRVALHVCGAAARKSLLNGNLAELTKHAPRVQVNGSIWEEELPMLASKVGHLITQYSGTKDKEKTYLLISPISNHSLLVDSSRGRGIMPSQWPTLITTKCVGRAGGLGPENIYQQLKLFDESATPGAWVDMESKLRDAEDWFSLDLAKECVKQFKLFLAPN